MRTIKYIVIHCSDTYPDMDVGAGEIRRWHMIDNGWSDIGYHYVINRYGGLETGRPEELMGAHVKGHNTTSIGICMVGGKAKSNNPTSNFTAAQWDTLASLVVGLTRKYPKAQIVGHYELDSGKTCPNFDVQAWSETL